MTQNIAVVVTSISGPNAVLSGIAKGCADEGWRFYLAGDRKSPADFALEGCHFFGVDRQLASGFASAGALPFNHYSRKNIGYLIAIRDGAHVIVETDDDNIPLDPFWSARERRSVVAAAEGQEWLNVYRYFSEAVIWPRGLPLDEIHKPVPDFAGLPRRAQDCPVQQGLADDNPDVDAVFRLVSPGVFTFRQDRRVAIGQGTWCPFNSQNTTFWRDAFPLLYLPSYCSFRMTDIWRSFVAERICWENGWSVLFHEPTVRQERNVHDLMRDFADEIPGYLNNRRICDLLAGLSMKPGLASIPDNMRIAYAALADIGLVDAAELRLLDLWFADLKDAGAL